MELTIIDENHCKAAYLKQKRKQLINLINKKLM